MIAQQHVNLLAIIGGKLKRVASTNGGEYHGPCPFCGGTDRFVVQPNAEQGGHWFCRQCGRSGDSIAFLMARDGLSFSEACDRLNVALPEHKRDSIHHRVAQPAAPVNTADLKDAACFQPAWQKAADDFIYERVGNLWDDWETNRAGRYLEDRGIDRDTAVAAFIGLNKQEYRATWGPVEVWLPRGIIIPWEIDHQYWNLRIRRPNADLHSKDDPKYVSPKGIANGLFGADFVKPGKTVYMTEGEFDALVLDKTLIRLRARHYAVVSVGSCTGARVLRWVTLLALAETVYVCFDADEAGEQAAGWWLAALPKIAKRLRPSRKDITEMYLCNELSGFVGATS